MPIYSVKGPDGRIYEVEGPAGASEEQVIAAVRRQILMSPGTPANETPESGFTPALKSGFSELKSGLAALAGRSGIMDQAAAEKYIKEQEAYQQRTFKPTATFGEAPVTKTLELLGGSVPFMAAPIAAGALAATAPVAAPVATALGLGAAGATSAGQFTGSFLRRQMEEGKTLGQTDLQSAVLASIPAAALDAVSFKMLPGIRQLLTAAGKEVTPSVAKRIAEQGVKEVAKDYALATGKSMGAEGLTEAGQQFFERLQAGLSLTDEKARDEYVDSLIGGAVLSGTLAPAGRFVERRGQAKKEDAQRLEEARQLDAAEARREAEAEQRQLDLEAQAPAEAQREPYFYQPQQPLPGMEAVPPTETEAPKAEFVDYARQVRTLEGQMDDLRALAQNTPDLDKKLELNRQYESLAAAKTEAERLQKEQAKTAPDADDDKIAKLKKRMAKAEEAGDIPAQARIAQQLQELGVTSMAEPTGEQQTEMPLFPFEGKSETKASFAAREFKPGAPDIEAQEQEALAEAERQREEAAKEAERERKIAPEVGALRRISERPAPAVGEGQVSGMVDRLVDTALRGDGKAPGRVVAGAGVAPLSQADALRGQLALARATDNRARAEQIAAQLKEMGEAEADTGGDIATGEELKKAGVEGRLSAQAIMDNRVTRMSQSQMAAYDRLVDYLQTVRESDQNVAEAKKQTLQDAAERLKDTVVGLALNEIDARRAQAGKPELAADRKLEAVKRISGLLDELIKRSAGLFNVVETPAVTRGTLTLQSAKEGPPPAGRRLFGNMAMAANALRGQVRDVIDEIGEIKAPEPRKAAPTKPRVSNELRMMFQGQERSVEQQFTDAFDRAKSDEDYRTLKDIQRNLPRLSDAAREEAMIQVRRAETGQPLEIRGALQQELADMARAGVSEQGQAELFPGEDERGVTRATSANFMRFLNSADVQKRRAKIEEARKQAEFQAKRAATIQNKLDEEKRKQDEMLAKLELAKNKSPVEAARERLAAVADKNAEAVRIAKEINEQRSQARVRIAAMVRQLEDALAQAKKKEAEVEELVDYIVQKSLTYPRNKQYQQGMAQFLDQQTASAKAVESIQNALDKARALQAKVLEDQASNTIDNALIAEGAKAQRKIDKAEQELKAAQEQEAGAKRRLEAVRGDIKPQRPQTPAERLAAIAEQGGVRVYRDTSDPEVQRQVAAERKNIAKAEEAHAKAQTSGDEKAMEQALVDIENAYNKMYTILNNAPVRREEIVSPAEARAMEEFEAAQRAVLEKTIQLFQDKAGVAPLKLTERRTVASVKNVKTGRIETQIKKESVAQQEKRVKEETATGKYPARALEELAKARAELKEVQDQIAYIDANPAAPRSEAKARQKAARTAAVAKRKGLEAKVTNLAKAQRKVVSEARVEKEAETALKKERRRMLKDEDLFPSPANVEMTYDGAPASQADGVLRDVLEDLAQVAPSTRTAYDAATQEKLVRMVRRAYEQSVGDSGVAEKLRVLDSLDPTKIGFVGEVPRAKRVVDRRTELKVARANEQFTPESFVAQYGTSIDEESPLNDMTFAEAARYGAKKTSSPMVRQLFERLAEVFDQAPDALKGRVYAVEGLMTMPKMRAAGIYAPDYNVVFNPSGKVNKNANKVLLHELTHAATVYALGRSPALDARVGELRQRVVDWLETSEGKAYFRAHSMGLGRTRQTIYGLKNNKEFLAELFADREFQKMLAVIPSDKPRKSILTRFVQTLAKFFNFPGEAAQSVFAEAVALSEEVMNAMVRDIYNVPNAVDLLKGTGEVEPLLADDAKYANAQMERLAQKSGMLTSKQRGIWESIKANTTGLAFATQLVDRFAGFERLAKYMDALKGSQMLYYLRMYDQRMNFVSQAVNRGALQINEQKLEGGRKAYTVDAKEGASIRRTVEILKDAQPYVGNAEAVNQLFTKYLAALRADRVGVNALNFGPNVTPQLLAEIKQTVEGNAPLFEVFKKARDEYNAYNRDLINFVAQTGALSKELADRLSSTNDYIPFYREENGNAMLFIAGETPIRIGSIAEQPYLQELVGDDAPIKDFMTSSVQNTNLLVDMALRNLATKNAVFELVNLNAAKIVGAATGPDVVKFKVDGEDRYAVMDTESVTVGGKRFDTGVPAELLVKGMEGIPTQMPALFRIAAMPAQLLRKAVTLSPVYMAKQLFRDSLAAPIIAGADFTPVLGALKQIGDASGKTLEKRGITGGQYMTGTNEDLTKILREVSEGGPGWMSALGKLEAIGMAADSLTRRAQYNSYIAQGLSEMEATLLSLESMNFNKRGASPSVHIANSLIPFLNAQIQGLNVLYKAFTGQMPLNDRVKLRQKLLVRGGLLAGASLLYAALMDDDEAYKNARPDEKYGNWFIRVPGFDEPIRVPVPFEIGYIFKALPEALYNSMTDKHGGEEAVKAFKQILLQTIPGGSSYGIPQILKPAIEAGLGKSFYTGRDILSAREKELLPEEQFRANTAELSKVLGKEFGISPVVFENLVRGYTGTLGLAFLHTLSLGAPKTESPEAAVKRLSDYPLVGGVFQPNDAGGITNAVYERFNEDIKVRNTYKKMLEEGRTAEANSLLQRRGQEIFEAEIGDVFKTNMTKLTQAERAIAASAMSPEEKRKRLDDIRRIKTGLAQSFREAADKTRPQ